MKIIGKFIFLLFLLLSRSVDSQTLTLPPRPSDAMSGSDSSPRLLPRWNVPSAKQKFMTQVAHGNVPDFLRKLSPVHAQTIRDGKTNSAIYYVTPDYLAVGSDEDYFLTPLTPITAQKVADLLHCSLPTRKMVDDIYAAATVKLVPSPIPPSPAMATVTIFIQHNLTVRNQRAEQLSAYPLGTLVAGHKKDVVITSKLIANPGKVAIYGWHKPDGKPIQPLYTGHADTYADYSHGIRLVTIPLAWMAFRETIPEVLADPALSRLLSDEGPVATAKYPAAFRVTPPASRLAIQTQAPAEASFAHTNSYQAE